MDEIKYGLIGVTLKHSYSPIIYQSLGLPDYQLIEIGTDNLDSFMLKRDFKGLNVTIPFKQEVLRYLDSQDEVAKSVGCVNTIINSANVLKGYNTDVFGFMSLLNFYQIDLTNRDVLILGSGATSKTVAYSCKKNGAKSISFASRQDNSNTINYNDLQDKFDVIINTTPVGMYPNNKCAPLDISKFDRCTTVIDVIYNPLKTWLIVESELSGKKAYGGLYMLVAQAVYSYSLFTNTVVTTEMINNEYYKLYRSLVNIVLIGLSGSGKTSIASMFSDRKVINTDKVIEDVTNESISNIFSNVGEKYFRRIETKIIERYYKSTGLILDCGGGVVLNSYNMKLLKQNGLLFQIERDLDKIKLDYSRPLISDYNDLDKMYSHRKEKYQYYSDYIIINNDKLESSKDKIEEILNEVNSD